jgi:hypothetical protein
MARWIPKKCKTGLVVIGFWDDILKTWNCFSVETLMRPQVCDTGTWHDYPFIKYKQWQAFPVSSLLKKSVYWRRALRVSLKPKSMLNPIVLQRYACKLEAWLTSGFCAKPTEQVNDLLENQIWAEWKHFWSSKHALMNQQKSKFLKSGWGPISVSSVLCK